MPQHAAKNFPPGGKRATQAEVVRRYNYVEQRLAEGASRPTLIEECRTRFRIAARTVDNYIAQVNAAWSEEQKVARPMRKAAARHRLLALRTQMLKAESWSNVIKLEGLLVDIDGLRGDLEPEAQTIPVVPEMTMEEADELNRRATVSLARHARRQPMEVRMKTRESLVAALKEIDSKNELADKIAEKRAKARQASAR